MLDLIHVFLGALIGAALTLTAIVAVLAVRGFSDLRERSEKDEAIDAATFLASDSSSSTCGALGTHPIGPAESRQVTAP